MRFVSEARSLIKGDACGGHSVAGDADRIRSALRRIRYRLDRGHRFQFPAGTGPGTTAKNTALRISEFPRADTPSCRCFQAAARSFFCEFFVDGFGQSEQLTRSIWMERVEAADTNESRSQGTTNR